MPCQIATFFGILLSKLKRKPLISIPHGLASEQEQYGLLGRLGRHLERWAFSKPAAVVALSTNDALRLREFDSRMRVVYIPTGIDVEAFNTTNSREEKRKELGVRAETTLILSTSRLIAVKGLRYLIDSVPKLKGNFMVLLAGTGPQEKELKNRVALTNQCSRIRFLGFRKDVPDLLAAADIFVLPSISEGLPMGLLEAMASNCACIVTDIGLPVENERTGIVVPPADANALASAIQRLMDDKELRRCIAKNARKFVEKNCDWNKITRKLTKIYELLFHE